MTDPHNLRMFMTLAEQLHFGKTSRQHHMTVSALSRAIKKMEQDLGTCLFERSNKHVALTQAGEKFYQFARQTVSGYDTLHHEFLNPTQLQGKIKLFATVTAAYSILPDLIKTFRTQHPNITTYLETGASKNSHSRILNNEADFSIGIITHPISRTLLYQKILETPLVFIVPQGSLSEKVTDFELLFPEQGDLASILTQYLQQHDLPIHIHSYIEGHEAILAMVAAGLGGAILPQIVLDHSHLKKAVKVIRLSPELPFIEVGVFMKESSLDSPIKRAFWESCSTTQNRPDVSPGH